MDKKAYNLRFLLSIFLTVLFLSSSCFSVLAKPAGKAPIEDFEISDEEEEEEEVEEAGDKSKAAAPKKNNDEEAEEEEEEDEEGDEDEDDEEGNLTPEQKAAKKAAAKAAREALEKKVIELENKVRELGKDNSAIKGLLTDEANINAVNESGFLLEKLIEASLSDKNPNYTDIKSYGEKLQEKNANLSLAYYAQGLGYMYAKKPNLAKAMDLFGKAKKDKKPYKDASSAYNTCLLKRFGLFVVLGVLLVIVLVAAFIVKKIKAKKAANANANTDNTADSNTDGAPDIDLQKLLDTPVEDSSANNENKANDISALSNTGVVGTEPKQVNEPDNNPLIQQQKPEPVKANTIAANNTSNAPLPNQTTNENKDINNPAVKQEQPLAIANNTNEASANNAATPSAPAKKVVRVVKKVRVRKDANGNSYVVSEGSSTQSDAIKEDDQNSETAKLEREKIRNIARPIDKPLPPVDTQLDILWGNLSRKAMQGHIGLLARKSDSISSSLGSSVPSNNSYSGYSSDNRVTDFRLGDVSIDLSEEALKDDLVGKLKMLAITDAELRELFAMKNPAHIPHLIEYIMTKPEPMRLAFIAKELGNYADPAVVDALSSLLYNEDERVVLAAIQGLEATKLPAAVVPLCPFLKSDIPLYAQAARTALSKFGAVKIMQALKDLPTFTDLKLKEAGIFVLSRMKGEPVEKILKSLLNDESTSVRIQTILAMSYQKNPVYIDPLREFYRIANETEKSMTRKAIVYLNGFNK